MTDRLKTVYPHKTSFCGGYNNNNNIKYQNPYTCSQSTKMVPNQRYKKVREKVKGKVTGNRPKAKSHKNKRLKGNLNTNKVRYSFHTKRKQ